MGQTSQLKFTDSQASRLTVEDLHLVDCDPPESFDALTRLASRLFGVPVALVSIVEEEKDRQFFLSQQGLPELWAERRQTPLTHSFCQHVKRTGKPLIVSDSRRHPLVQDNLAIKDLDVVAYLGVPIEKPGGDVIGAICVIDGEEREWSDEDLLTLGDLAHCVNDEILLRASMVMNQVKHERSVRYNALRETVTLAFMAPDIPIEERFNGILKMSCEALGFDSGLISKIDSDCIDILFHVGEDGGNVPENVSDLSGSLSALVMAGQEQVAFPDVSESGHANRCTLAGTVPGSYVGMPLIFDGTLYGTLELHSAQPRKNPFSNEEQSIFGIISMSVCAHLGIFGKIRTLQDSETNLLNFLMEKQRSAVPGNVS